MGDLTPRERLFLYGYMVVSLIVSTAGLPLLILGEGAAKTVGAVLSVVLAVLIVGTTPAVVWYEARRRRARGERRRG